MKAAVLKRPKNLALMDLPRPRCPPGGALIRVEACAVCGTDIKMLDQGHRDLCYPRILGHEVVGRIEEIDRKVQAGPGLAGHRLWTLSCLLSGCRQPLSGHEDNRLQH